MKTVTEPIHRQGWHPQLVPLQSQTVPDLDAKGLLLRDALAILTVVGALAAFYGMIKLVSYLSGIPFP